MSKQSFLRGELRQSLDNVSAAPFDLKVSVVPINQNDYLTLSPETENEEIIYYTTVSGSAGGPGTIHVTARGYNHGATGTSSTNYRSHAVNDTYYGAWNHLEINDKLSQSEGGTIADTKSLAFGAAAYIKTTDDGTNLKIKDGSNTEVTLSDILALTGADGKFLNTTADTTRGFLDDKLTVSGNGITKTKVNPGANEHTNLNLEFASQSDAETGTNDTKLITPAKLQNKIDFTRASDSDSNTGSDTIKFVTPKQIHDQTKNIIGAKTTSYSFGTIYQAPVAGFVQAYVTGYDNFYQTGGDTVGYTDSSSNPTTVVAITTAYFSPAQGGQGSAAITFPVAKNDYWKVTSPSNSGRPTTMVLRFVAFQ